MFTEKVAELPAAEWRTAMRLRIWMCLIFALFLVTEGLFGQEYRGSLSGRVLDPSGAAVPGAQVTLTNTATNVRLTTVLYGRGSESAYERGAVPGEGGRGGDGRSRNV